MLRKISLLVVLALLVTLLIIKQPWEPKPAPSGVVTAPTSAVTSPTPAVTVAAPLVERDWKGSVFPQLDRNVIVAASVPKASLQQMIEATMRTWDSFANTKLGVLLSARIKSSTASRPPWETPEGQEVLSELKEYWEKTEEVVYALGEQSGTIDLNGKKIFLPNIFLDFRFSAADLPGRLLKKIDEKVLKGKTSELSPDGRGLLKKVSDNEYHLEVFTPPGKDPVYTGSLTAAGQSLRFSTLTPDGKSMLVEPAQSIAADPNWQRLIGMVGQDYGQIGVFDYPRYTQFVLALIEATRQDEPAQVESFRMQMEMTEGYRAMVGGARFENGFHANTCIQFTEKRDSFARDLWPVGQASKTPSQQLLVRLVDENTMLAFGAPADFLRVYIAMGTQFLLKTAKAAKDPTEVERIKGGMSVVNEEFKKLGFTQVGFLVQRAAPTPLLRVVLAGAPVSGEALLQRVVEMSNAIVKAFTPDEPPSSVFAGIQITAATGSLPARIQVPLGSMFRLTLAPLADGALVLSIEPGAVVAMQQTLNRPEHHFTHLTGPTAVYASKVAQSTQFVYVNGDQTVMFVEGLIPLWAQSIERLSGAFRDNSEAPKSESDQLSSAEKAQSTTELLKEFGVQEFIDKFRGELLGLYLRDATATVGDDVVCVQSHIVLLERP